MCLETGGLSDVTEVGLGLPVLCTFHLCCAFQRVMDSERIKAVTGSGWLNQGAATRFRSLGAEPWVQAPGRVLYLLCLASIQQS